MTTTERTITRRVYTVDIDDIVELVTLEDPLEHVVGISILPGLEGITFTTEAQ